MATKFQFRRDTTANWTVNNPVLSEGEMGLDTDLNQFKIGDGVTAWTALPWAVNGAVIDDGVTGVGSTWSSSKISTEILNMAAANDTTPAPQLSTTSVQGNEGGNTTVTITNYQATGVTYEVSTNDASIATASIVGDTITINFVDGGDTEQSTLIVLSAFDAAYSYASYVNISVTSVSLGYVAGSTADDAIVINDFSLVEYSSIDMDTTTGALVTGAASGTYVSNPFEQEAIDTNWLSYSASMVIGGEIVTPTYKFSETELFLGGIADFQTSGLVLDVLGTQHACTFSVDAAQQQLATPTQFYTDQYDYGVQQIDIGAGLDGFDVSADGKKVVTIQTGYQLRIVTSAIPHDFTSGTTTEFFDLPLPTNLSKSVYSLSDIKFSYDGMYLYGIDQLGYHTSYYAVIVWQLTEAFDVTTAHSPIGSSYGLGHFSEIYSDSSYGITDAARPTITVAQGGTYLAICAGYNATSTPDGGIFYYSLLTPHDPTTASYIDKNYDTSYVYNAMDVTEDLRFTLSSYGLDDNGTQYDDIHVACVNDNSLGKVYAVGGTNNPATLFLDSVNTTNPSTNTYRARFSKCGRYIYILDGNGMLYKLTLGFSTYTRVIATVSCPTLTETIDKIYTAPPSVPNIYVDTHISDVNQLDHANNGTLMTVADSGGLYEILPTEIKKTVTLNSVADEFRYLEFRAEVAAGTKVYNLTINLTKAQ